MHGDVGAQGRRTDIVHAYLYIIHRHIAYDDILHLPRLQVNLSDFKAVQLAKKATYKPIIVEMMSDVPADAVENWDFSVTWDALQWFHGASTPHPRLLAVKVNSSLVLQDGAQVGQPCLPRPLLGLLALVGNPTMFASRELGFQWHRLGTSQVHSCGTVATFGALGDLIDFSPHTYGCL